MLLALALRDESLSGAEAAEVADRALELAAGTRRSIPRGARGREAGGRLGSPGGGVVRDGTTTH